MAAEFGLHPMLEILAVEVVENLVVEVAQKHHRNQEKVVENLVVEVAQKHHRNQEIPVVALARWNPYASLVSWHHEITSLFPMSLEMGSWKS